VSAERAGGYPVVVKLDGKTETAETHTGPAAAEPVAERRPTRSDQHPLDLVERHLIAPAVVELGRAGIGVVRHLARLLQRAAV